jgi:hypothetical protein
VLDPPLLDKGARRLWDVDEFPGDGVTRLGFFSLQRSPFVPQPCGEILALQFVAAQSMEMDNVRILYATPTCFFGPKPPVPATIDHFLESLGGLVFCVVMPM